MKKTLIALALCAFPMSAFADVDFNTAKTFQCTGSGIPASSFELSSNSGTMPLATVSGNTVSVEYTIVNGVDTLAVLVNENGTLHVVTGAINSDVTFVDGDFWVVCSQQQ